MAVAEPILNSRGSLRALARPFGLALRRTSFERSANFRPVLIDSAEVFGRSIGVGPNLEGGAVAFVHAKIGPVADEVGPLVCGLSEAPPVVSAHTNIGL